MKIETKYKIENAASNDQTRAAITNILIEDGKAIACDGHILACVPCEHAESENKKTVRADDFRAIRKAQGARSEAVEASLNGEIKAMTKDGGTLMFTSPVDQYPNWKVVLPKADVPVQISVGIDATLLLKLAEALGASGNTGKNPRQVILDIQSETDHIKVRVAGNKDAFGVIMPVRVK